MNNLGRVNGFGVKPNVVLNGSVQPGTENKIKFEVGAPSLNPLDLCKKKIVNLGEKDINVFDNDLDVVNKYYVDEEVDVVNTRVNEIDTNLNTKINTLNTRVDNLHIRTVFYTGFLKGDQTTILQGFDPNIHKYLELNFVINYTATYSHIIPAVPGEFTIMDVDNFYATAKYKYIFHTVSFSASGDNKFSFIKTGIREFNNGKIGNYVSKLNDNAYSITKITGI